MVPGGRERIEREEHIECQIEGDAAQGPVVKAKKAPSASSLDEWDGQALKDQLDEVVKTVGTLTHDGPPETPSNKPALGSPQVPLIPQRTVEALGLLQEKSTDET